MKEVSPEQFMDILSEPQRGEQGYTIIPKTKKPFGSEVKGDVSREQWFIPGFLFSLKKVSVVKQELEEFLGYWLEMDEDEKTREGAIEFAECYDDNQDMFDTLQETDPYMYGLMKDLHTNY